MKMAKETPALYGVRGGNGVIVITTKSGKKNQETQFTLDSSYGVQEVENFIDVLNAAQYAWMSYDKVKDNETNLDDLQS